MELKMKQTWTWTFKLLTRNAGVKLKGPDHCCFVHFPPVIFNPKHFLQFTADSCFQVKVSRKCPINNWGSRDGSQAEAGSRDPERPGPGGETEARTVTGLRGPEAGYRGRGSGVRSGDICLGAESRITAFYHLYLLNNCRSIIALIMTKLQTLYKIHIFYKQNVEQVYIVLYILEWSLL